MRLRYLPALIAVAVSITAYAAPPVTQAPSTTAPPVLDGVAEDPCWLGRAPENAFVRLKSSESAASQTRFLVARDDANLYLFAACEEKNPDELKMNFTAHDDALWANDCVEIFLDPANNRQEYGHIIANPAGAIHDAWVVQDGLSHDASWESGAEVACRINRWNWTAEMAIPLGALKLHRGGSDTWAFNIAREKKTEPRELSSWAFAGRNFHDPSQFGEITGMDLDYSRFMISTSRPMLEDVRFEAAEGTALSTTLRVPVRISGRDARTLDIRIDFHKAGAEPGLFRSATTIPAGWTKLGFGLRLPKPGEYDCTVQFRERGTDTVVHRNTFSLDLDMAPLEITLQKPWYRNSIYHSRPTDEIVADVALNLAGDEWHDQAFDVKMVNASGRAIHESHQHFSSQATSRIAVPIQDIPDGSYTLQVSAEVQGETLTESVQIHKLPSSDHEVCLDQDGQVLVDGEPFFPWGFMGAGPDERLAKAGYNLIHTYVARYMARDEKLMSWLDKCHDLGLQVVMHPYPGKIGFHGYEGKPEFTDEEVAEIRAFVEKYKDHPALFGWYMCDEPRGQKWRDALKMIADVVREVDPYHPTIALDNGPGGLLGLREIGDILWIDPYPGFGVGEGPHVPMGDKIRLAVNDVFRGLEDATKPLWIAPQAFSYGGDDPQRQKAERAPTYPEERSMTYMAIVHGVEGVVYYAWVYAKKFAGLRIGFLHGLCREMQVLMPALLDGEEVGAETMCEPEQGIVHTRAIRHDGDTYVIATNMKPMACTGYVYALNLSGEYRVLSENRLVEVSEDGAIVDQFEPYATHIYTNRTDLPDMKTLAEIQTMIEQAKEAGEEQ